MSFTLAQYGLGAFSGGLVSFSLGLVGGGGSILAVPLIIYLVGLHDPHLAIGTSALAVAFNAATGLLSHARARTVKWRCGLVFAAAGVVGAFLGSTVGKAFNGQRLLILFALVMVAVGFLMLKSRRDRGVPGAECTRQNAPQVLGTGFGTGLFSGFFGIGGGFLIVPGLVASTRMPMINAVGTSLVGVTAFGLTSALNYAASGLVAWGIAIAFIGGGVVGSVGGMRLARHLAHGQALRVIFAGMIFVVSGYMIWRSLRGG
jgi:uncharacterized protein